MSLRGSFMSLGALLCPLGVKCTPLLCVHAPSTQVYVLPLGVRALPSKHARPPLLGMRALLPAVRVSMAAVRASYRVVWFTTCAI
jgi:hypothetical protein